MKYSRVNKLPTTTTIICLATIELNFASELQDTFSGPGRIDCFGGACEFTVDTSLGCSDPCHTYTSSNIFEYSFSDVALVSNKIRHYPSQSMCYYKKAVDIDMGYWWDPWPLKIDEGCIATCTGCTFYPTETFSGPGFLYCLEGDCYNYSHGDEYNDCGAQLEDASEEWGEESVLLSGSFDAETFQGFNNIGTSSSIRIPEGCSLDYSGCQFTKRRVRHGMKREKRA